MMIYKALLNHQEILLLNINLENYSGLTHEIPDLPT